MGWGDYTGTYNWWDTDFSTTDTDTDITDVDFSTYDTADADADTVAADQQVEDLFEDPDFIASLAQLMETQNFFPDEQSLGEWTNDDWDSYFENFLDPNYNWWDTDFSTYEETKEETEEEKKKDVNGNPLPPTTNVPVGTTHEVTDGEGRTIIYTCKVVNGKKVWVKGEGEGEGDDEKLTDVLGQPLPDPTGLKNGERHEVNIPYGGTVIYEIKDGVWHQIEEEEEEEEGGLAGLLGSIPDWLKDLFKLFIAGKAVKGAKDVIDYEVPTGQGAAMSAYEKAHPLDIDMGLESLGPNYLQDQLYGIPIGAENVPAATHTLGFPYAEEIEEEVQGGQRGGIMNARSHGDIVPALLEPGEFVMNLQSVKGAGNGDARQGAKNMYKMMRQLERRG
jgi:hypothetical protein